MTELKSKEDAEALINKEGIEYVSVRFTDPTACRSMVPPFRASKPSTSPT